MSRFKKGQTVYMGRGDKMKTLIITKVVDNPLLPIFQYAFKEVNSICGEQSIRADIDGDDLSLGECFKPNNGGEIATHLNTMANIMGQSIEPELQGVGNFFKEGSLFFKPDLKFCDWLIKYANGRMIIDVGAGQGHLVRMVKMRGGKIMGLEPNFDYAKFIKFSINRGIVPNPNEILPWTIQRAKGLIEGMGSKAILVFARPCHNDFVEIGIKNMSKETEALYITVPENLIMYNDLGIFKENAVELFHDGNSEDNEVIYSIKKK